MRTKWDGKYLKWLSPILFTSFVLLGWLIVGCGSGGFTSPNQGGGVDEGLPLGQSTLGQTLFHVDVSTGEVTVTPLDRPEAAYTVGGEPSRAVFGGAAIKYNTSRLLDEPGNPGRKVLEVSLTNQSGETIGRLPNGMSAYLRVLFGPIKNVDGETPFTALPKNWKVITIAGSTSGFLDGIGSNAKFNIPVGVALGEGGTLYVTDAHNHAIRRITSAGIVTTLAGNGTAGFTDGAGAAAQFNNPHEIDWDEYYKVLYIADYWNHALRRVTPSGVVHTVADIGTTPVGVAVVAGYYSTTIYVTTGYSNTVKKVTFTGGDPWDAANYTVTDLAGSTQGFTDGVGTAAKFNNPGGIDVDDEGILYLCDTDNHAIRRIDPSTAEVSIIAGTGTAGSTDGAGDVAQFTSPKGIAVGADGALYVAEDLGHRVRRIVFLGGDPTEAANYRVSTIAGTAGSGFADGPGDVAKFSQLAYIVGDEAGNLFVCDYGTHRIRKLIPRKGFQAVGSPVGTAPAEPVRLLNPDGLQAGNNQPYLDYQPNGGLSPGETTSTRKWMFSVPAGVSAFEFMVRTEAHTEIPALPEPGSWPCTVLTWAGNGVPAFGNGAANLASFFGPAGVVADDQGRVAVADFFTNRIRGIDEHGEVITLAGSGIQGFKDGRALEARFNRPTDVAVDRAGNIYVADYGNKRIRIITLVCVEDSCVHEVSYGEEYWYYESCAARRVVATIAGIGRYSADRPIEGFGNVAQFQEPMSVAVDRSGDHIYVADAGLNRIFLITYNGGDRTDPKNYYVKTLAGPTGFNRPSGVEVGRDGVVYVADTSNNAVKKVLPDGTVMTLASMGFNRPISVAVDDANQVYVADLGNHLIKRVSPLGNVTVLAGQVGIAGFADGPGGEAKFNLPRGVALEPSGNLLVADFGNNRIRRIERTMIDPVPSP